MDEATRMNGALSTAICASGCPLIIDMGLFPLRAIVGLTIEFDR